MLDYGVFENILSSWPKAEIPLEVSEDSLLERIRQILAEAGISNDVTKWKADIIPLIRHYLLRDSARKGKKSSLRVPSHSGWPNVEEWRRHGIWVWPISDNAFILKPEPWCPEWLDAGEEGVFADAFKDEKVRQEGYCEADPFITEATGYTTYFCPGQREAIRASFLMRHGHTLIVNLPTGSGKSLVGQAPALVHKQDGNLVLFVVPTVALAIDQERQMKEYFNKNKELDRLWPLAWHAGLSGEDRHEIRSRMRYGTQRILFTSPEAIMTSLLREVFDVARSGMLGYLVIDEAHLVTQWGDEFRPEFQGLAAIRNAMLRQSGEYAFRTLLLSATFTAETIETLASLFGPRDKVDLVSAVHLRPEPQYWFSRANHSDDKQSKVLEALRHAPRPFILYVTRPKEAEHWHSLLKSRVGLNRIECFHGKTDYSSRYRIIQAWTENKLDGIVATSAFGLGIDKQDVRTIIHATIPETVDRFYQEVGRGGRDGKTSVSLLI
ncbi:MAG: protein DpdF, partial [Desulfomonile sp.]